MATKKRVVDDEAENRINNAYAEAAMKAGAPLPASMDPRFKNIGKTTRPTKKGPAVKKATKKK